MKWMVGKFVLKELRCSMETHGCFTAGLGLAMRLLPKRDFFSGGAIKVSCFGWKENAPVRDPE